MAEDYLEKLNEPQRRAVLHQDGPLMIIAGAGSGKTRVLTQRIAQLMYTGIPPYNILALTFTNKAAGEMRERIQRIVGNDARYLWMGTFHSVFAKILRVEADKLGYTSNFSIYDTDDSKSLLKTIVKELNLDDKQYSPNKLLNRISWAKSRQISYREYKNNPEYQQQDLQRRYSEFSRVYEAYQYRCFRANAMDFDDLLFNTNILFRDNPDVLEKYQRRFRYILIDEFQDTNFAQYAIVRQLAAMHKNVCVVGDDAQSIYAFRGADIQNILNFERDYPDLTTIRLEQNYRSTQNIVAAANAVIARNLQQLKKEVWTDNPEGEKIELIKTHSDIEEGRAVVNRIFEEKLNQQRENSDFAILYRTNAQSRALEEALRKANIKYRIIGGLSFYQRKEVKDLIAYLRLTVNHHDEEAFKRVVNFPKRGIGNTSLSKIIAQAADTRQTLWQSACQASQVLGSRGGKALEEFTQMIGTFAKLAQEADAYTAANTIAKQSGVLAEYTQDQTIEGISRQENLQELLNALKEFVDNAENEDKSLSAFLQEVSLITSADQSEDDDEKKVTLMTIHGAKGLEFPHVFVVGMEENLFPSQMMLNNREDLEEERRLFYVAMTRAQTQLSLTYATSRYQYGSLRFCEPSRFLDEIDAQYIKPVAGQRVSPKTEEKPSTSFVNTLKQRRKPTLSGTVHKPSADFSPSDTKDLAVGMQVEHRKFGFGKVINLEDFQKDKKALIDFDNHGEKTLLLSFAKLKIHL